MTHRIFVISAALAITLLFGSQARADFLGLAPGDYNITLPGSGLFCGGTACTGSVHIPTGTVTTVNFDWTFLTPGHDFLWDDAVLNAMTSPNGVNSCASESPANSSFCAIDDTSFTILVNNDVPALILMHQEVSNVFATNLWGMGIPGIGTDIRGAWIATPAQVPEPNALLLFGSALSALWFWRRATRRR